MILPTAIVGSLTLQRRGVGNLRVALRFGLVGALGAFAGAKLALALPGSTLKIIFAVFVGLVGTKLAWDGWRATRE